MRRSHGHLLKARRQAGFSLLDGLIALAILAFGLLGMSRMQARTLAQATDNQTRFTAVQYSDELLSAVLIDAGNYACYTLPASGTCGSTAARAITTDWNTRLQAALPGAAATSTYDATTGRLKVSVSWTAKTTNDDGSHDSRKYEATTDVRQ